MQIIITLAAYAALVAGCYVIFRLIAPQKAQLALRQNGRSDWAVSGIFAAVLLVVVTKL